METAVLIQDVLEMDPNAPSAYQVRQRERALAKKKYYEGSVSRFVNIGRIKQGDNKEWAFLLDNLQTKLYWFVYGITLKERFCEDIVAATIAHTYENRALFRSGDHLVGYMYNFARYESFQCMKKGGGAITVTAEGGEELSWYIEAYANQFEGFTIEDRVKWDEWQDHMIDQIMDTSRRLPVRWVRLIKSYLACHSIREVRQQWGRNYIRISDNAFEQLRKLIRHEDFMKSVKTEQLQEVRNCLEGLSVLTKKLIRRVLLGQTDEEIISEFWSDSPNGRILYRHLLSIAGDTIRDVWPDPALLNRDANRIFFSQPKGEEVDKIFKEVFIDVEESSFEHANNARVVGKKYKGRRESKKSLWTIETVQLVCDLRTKGASWTELEDSFNSSREVMRRLVKKHLDIDLDHRVGRKPLYREERITVDEVIAIRAKYAADSTLSTKAIADEHRLSDRTVMDIVRGMRWSYVEGCNVNLTEQRAALNKKNRILELSDSGMINAQIAREVGCSQGLVSIVLKGRNLHKASRREWEKQVLKMLHEGASMASVRKKLGGKACTIKKLVDEEFPQYYTMTRRNPKCAFDVQTEREIREQRRNGKTIVQLAADYNVNIGTIRRVLEEINDN